jgi:hypothetical protein
MRGILNMQVLRNKIDIVLDVLTPTSQHKQSSLSPSGDPGDDDDDNDTDDNDNVGGPDNTPPRSPPPSNSNPQGGIGAA